MNQVQIRDFLTQIRAMWTHTLVDTDPASIKAWEHALTRVETGEAQTALKTHLKSSKGGYPPTPAQFYRAFLSDQPADTQHEWTVRAQWIEQHHDRPHLVAGPNEVWLDEPEARARAQRMVVEDPVRAVEVTCRVRHVADGAHRVGEETLVGRYTVEGDELDGPILTPEQRKLRKEPAL